MKKLYYNWLKTTNIADSITVQEIWKAGYNIGFDNGYNNGFSIAMDECMGYEYDEEEENDS